MIFRARHVTLGGHVHIRFFSAMRVDSTFAKLGELCCSVDEFQSLKHAMNRVEFLPEEDGYGQTKTS